MAVRVGAWLPNTCTTSVSSTSPAYTASATSALLSSSSSLRAPRHAPATPTGSGAPVNSTTSASTVSTTAGRSGTAVAGRDVTE